MLFMLDPIRVCVTQLSEQTGALIGLNLGAIAMNGWCFIKLCQAFLLHSRAEKHVKNITLDRLRPCHHTSAQMLSQWQAKAAKGGVSVW
jgi:hypothetical protein